MTALVVNVTLIIAVLVAAGAAVIGTARRRRRDRERRYQDRQLLLTALTSTTSEPDPQPAASPPVQAPSTGTPVDTATLAALVELFDDRRPRRPGVIAGLFTAPRAVWAAGARAGQQLGTGPAAAPPAHTDPDPGGE